MAVVRGFLNVRAGTAAEGEAAYDQFDDDIRALVLASGPERSADLIAVLAAHVHWLLRLAGASSGPGADLNKMFTDELRTQVDSARPRTERRVRGRVDWEVLPRTVYVPQS
ncbi:hypothetical protein [Streptomyces sp. WAC01280]|uniref:hypothetical protein n=1 Tax=Streptomyces sp. WAC01280 TaxID=2487424 RepID=UPI000F775594|nr:hypothetical protein [Streptomyces sp. WAC01280]RSS57475.1 hypothetical protein EF909_16160 [Streptomyces sp. WAC01280]